jgi:hypothetical protein
MLLPPAPRFDHLGRVGGGGEDLRDQRVRIQRDRRHQLFHLPRRRRRVLGEGVGGERQRAPENHQRKTVLQKVLHDFRAASCMNRSAYCRRRAGEVRAGAAFCGGDRLAATARAMMSTFHVARYGCSLGQCASRKCSQVVLGAEAARARRQEAIVNEACERQRNAERLGGLDQARRLACSRLNLVPFRFEAARAFERSAIL